MNASARIAAPPVIAGLRDIADRYDAYILDLWGCVHNGIAPFPRAKDALKQLKDSGKRVLLLSNAPRRASVIVEQLARIHGIGGDLYDAVLTSGEVAWQALQRPDDAEHATLGTRALHIGPERDLGMFEGSGIVRVTDPAGADFILATGPNTDDLDVAAHESLLRDSLARKLPLVCANPDLEVIRGETRLVCAGAIAQRYADLGGEVIYHGKPHAVTYRVALETLGSPDPARVLCVGDGLRTDILGANRAGLASAFIPGGIHDADLGIRMGETPDPARVAALLARFGASATYVLPGLKW
ncbi:MAG TPA: TIGR01459 family HAD-type hydrolase [Alphaproteobacteria bacterium]|nr:TIGR01459 family HAD-type hydrolase [Alphaproteobacteria bacterium]